MKVGYFILAVMAVIFLGSLAVFSYLNYQVNSNTNVLTRCSFEASAGSAGNTTTYSALLNQCLNSH